MKQTLQLKLGQQLTMTPQLQQAIRLLQLSTLELQVEIQQVLDSNLMLEIDETERVRNDKEHSDNQAAETPTTEKESSDTQEISEPDHIPDEMHTDSQWDDIYDGSTSYSAPGSDDQKDSFEAFTSAKQDLRDHLNWQLDLTPFSETDRIIAEAIVDAVGDDGYLTTSLVDLHEGLPAELEVELDEVAAVHHRIQRFDPIGVASQNLRECLLVQLKELPADTPWRKQAIRLVSEYLELLGSRQFKTIVRRLRVTEEELQLILDLVKSLNPQPGSDIGDSQTEYVVPDVYVRKVKGQWTIELNADNSPKLRVNPLYASMIKRGDTGDDNTYLKNHLQEARWFLKSLRSRNDTLMRVATTIVDRQEAFFEEGDEHMKPLVLREIADAVEMHESTISRITNQKYMHTPRGIFEFKYFFSSHVGTADGGECSATAIRAMIKRLINDEPAQKPLSDSKLATMLKNQGINVARRTIAKYREAMNIPPSNERKRLA